MTVSAKSELQQYVEQCEKELGFNASDVKPMNCNDGVPFAGSFAGEENEVINDFLLYQRVNSSVDLTVACRWLNNVGHVGSKPTVAATAAASVEMIIHNRGKGSTCFFTALEPGTSGDNLFTTTVSVNIVSPTDFPSADAYWSPPSDLNTKKLLSGNIPQPLQCVGCHVAGPYIASRRIAPYLAQFGLLNDGHDTYADMTATRHYHAVGSGLYYLPTIIGPFGAWDSIIYKNIIEDATTNRPADDCSSACHSIGRNSKIGTLTAFNQEVQLLPSIQSDLTEILNYNLMPPNDMHSDYRWMNHSNAGGTGDWELLKDEAKYFQGIYDTCQNPTELQAHVVGGTDIFSTADPIPDHLQIFNLRDGLECLNGQQSSGQCHDYQLRYMCNGAWTDWINNDSPSKNGDYERRTDPGYKNLCSSPTEMQARTTILVGNTLKWPLVFTAPNDRLAAFDPSYGLACVNSDQPDGHCSNYVVRFICN